MNVRQAMSMLLIGFDIANKRAHEEQRTRPWRVAEIRNDQFVVIELPSGKKFRVTVKEEP